MSLCLSKSDVSVEEYDVHKIQYEFKLLPPTLTTSQMRLKKKLSSKYVEAKHEIELLKHFTIICEDSYQHVGI